MKKHRAVRHQAISDMCKDNINTNVIPMHRILTGESLKTSQRKLRMHNINFLKINKNR